ncbi:ligase-associated DNA damage response exonuclease [Pontivivens insulae]|uniref:Ribonuclease n=1 Tax=Pontivivens insulae TaxID=1639689 RepID=A0A2R8AD90_9RHOB|nr:ligase-associated DNA damage response exonuclease [Pontivivens insulae]RED14068.1 putative mRNA 3-end processing factor [Pontivivens insulae]SPF30142.1 Ribonuclease [Pontivivens insulae]
MRATEILELRPEGLFCPGGGFFIDPQQPVDRTLVTHGHGDHCRPGSRALLATADTCAIAQTRYGAEAFGRVEHAKLGEQMRIGEVDVRFVPAGHVRGSAQIIVEQAGQRVIVSGDYKRASDPTCLPFEPVPCDLFVTEATFGLPVFRHPPIQEELDRLMASLAAFPDRCHVIGAYALGKAQRMIAELRARGYDRPIWLHGALVKLTTLYQDLGVEMGEIRQVMASDKKDLAGEIVIAPPSALQDRWARRLPDPLPVGASGWMQVRARARQRRVELPLIVSDHCDWDALCATIKEVQAETVWVTHGAEEALVHWCQQQGMTAAPLSIAGLGEEED